MKNIFCLVCAGLILFSCRKEERQSIKVFVIQGVVTDALTQKPVAQINLGAFSLGEVQYSWNEPYVSYPTTYLQRAITDENGHFTFKIDDIQKYYLASNNIADRYKPAANINGNVSDFYLHEHLWLGGNADSFLQLNQNWVLSIQVFPK